MRVYTVPERYRSVIEAAIADAVRRIDLDQGQPDCKPRWVPTFAIDEQATGTLVIMVAGVEAEKMAMIPAA